MKNLFLTAVLAAGFGATQAAPPRRPGDGLYPATVVARATTLTWALAQRIPLHEGQYIAIRRLHLEMLNERRELEAQLDLRGASGATRDAELSAAQYRYEARLNELLRPEQRFAYQNLRANFTAHRVL